MHPNPRKVLPILAVIILAGAAFWYFNNQGANAQSLGLTATGTIEATQIRLASELGGKVTEVLAREGDSVEPNQVLVRFKDDLLQAQLDQAKAALAQAEANYELIAAGTPPDQQQAAVTAAQQELEQAQQALDQLYENANLMAAQSNLAVAQADKELDQASQHLDTIESAADQADIDAAQATVVLARKALEDAQDDFRPYENKPEDNLVRAQLQGRLALAQNNYDAAVTRLNNITGTSNQYDLELARAAKAAAEAKLADARETQAKYNNGPDPDAVTLAESRLETAKAHLQAAQAGPTNQQLNLAQAQVNQAQANINLVQTQLDQVDVPSPTAGSILDRLVEPGEVVAPGAALLTLADLTHLTITVYIPENRYGTVTLGQEARVKVDSFPGETFMGKVIYIADQAEFTPRNVQTAEGRQTTVFAVKLAVDNPDSRLKPGMPADVTFE
jgi:HlyD family secretion protein